MDKMRDYFLTCCILVIYAARFLALYLLDDSCHLISFGPINWVLEENAYICDIEIECFLSDSCIGKTGHFL